MQNRSELAGSDSVDFLQQKVSLGTTIMGVRYRDGVVLGADSRTTTGAYIANRVTDKLTPIADNVYVCRSGSAADTQAIADYVRWYLQAHSSLVGDDVAEVSAAAHLVRLMCYENKANLLAGMIVAGWDKRHGPALYSIPLGGSLVAENWTIGGSGSSFIYGYCDANFKENMTLAEAEHFVLNAVSLAMSRDGSSGGVVRTVSISATGVQRKMYTGDKLPYMC